MKKFRLKTYKKKFLVDTITPVSVYLRNRDKYPNSLLLESSDYNSNNNSFSYICFNQIASFEVFEDILSTKFPDKSNNESSCSKENLIIELQNFINRFKVQSSELPFISNGLFGYTSYDAVKYFEDIEISVKDDSVKIPDMYYGIYKNIIAINHFKNEAYIFCHSSDEQNNIDKISYFMNECKKQNIKVLGPSINKSENNFIVNDSDEILFGLGAIKGTGSSAVKHIIDERKSNGLFKDIFDFICRTNSRSVKKKTYQALELSLII